MKGLAMDELKLLTSGTTIKSSDIFRLNHLEVNPDEIVNSISDTVVLVNPTDSNNNNNPLNTNENKPLTFLEAQAYRKKNQIKIKFLNKFSSHCLNDLPFPLREFSELNNYFNFPTFKITDILQNIFKITEPTPIQKQTIPCIINDYSVVACAPTGSGKTLSYLIPILVKLKVGIDQNIIQYLQAPSREYLRSLVILPSRELAVQILNEFNLLIGREKFKTRMLEKQTTPGNHIRRLDFAVSTPLKLVQLILENQLNFSQTKYIILDEADILLGLGFAQQLDIILSYLDTKYTNVCFFSATVNSTLLKLIESVCSDPIKISIGKPLSVPTTIEQKLVFVNHEDNKFSTFKNLIENGNLYLPVLIFLQTIERANDLFAELVYDGYYAEVIHGNLKKKQRDMIVKAFREKKIWVLITTDLIARGIDFKGVQSVLNWDLPQSSSSYIHRIGRTGRAGCKGKAITFVTHSDILYLPSIISIMKQSNSAIPEWMLNLKKLNKNELKPFIRHGLRRKTINKFVIKEKKKKKHFKSF